MLAANSHVDANLVEGDRGGDDDVSEPLVPVIPPPLGLEAKLKYSMLARKTKNKP